MSTGRDLPQDDKCGRDAKCGKGEKKKKEKKKDSGTQSFSTGGDPPLDEGGS